MSLLLASGRRWFCVRPLCVDEKLVQELESSVEVDFYPAGGFLDGLALVVWSPPLHKRQPDNALSPQVVNANT